MKIGFFDWFPLMFGLLQRLLLRQSIKLTQVKGIQQKYHQEHSRKVRLLSWARPVFDTFNQYFFQINILFLKMAKKQRQSSHHKSSNGHGFKKQQRFKVKKKFAQQQDQPIAPAPIKEENTAIIGKPWSELQVQIREEILASLLNNKFTSMFPVQEAAIPLLLKNYDLAVEAQTGSGKTLSFLVPLLQKYLALNDPCKQPNQGETENSKAKVKFLLVSPTRELCQQSYSTLVRLLDHLPNKERSEMYKKYCHCATGGSELQQDLKRVQGGVYVLFGTVGRLREMGQQIGQNWLKKVDYLFVDEADRVLKEKGIEELIKSIQKLRRTAMFSATLQGMQQKHFQFFGMRNLAKISLKAIDSKVENPSAVQPQKLKGYVIPKSLQNTYIAMNDRLEKINFLISFLYQKMATAKIIVFLSTCACVDYYTKLLNLYFASFPAAKDNIYGIHGKLKTRRRKRIIQDFLGKSSGVLFATDVVSRGIDFQHIHFILQVDPPEDPDNYIHRIGRTARVNRPGTAILLIENHEEAFITYLGDKGVGVEKVAKDKFVSNEITTQALKEKMYEMIASDRDNVQKGKRAFVSYVRAYKEHDLKYIFQFKNVDIGMIAHSFLLFRIPRIKEILGKNISSFQQYDIDIEAIPWLDKNQNLQFSAKQVNRAEMRKQRDNVKVAPDIKNIKSRRKKVRRINQEKEMKQMNKEHKAILKSRKTKKNEEDSQEESYGNDYDEDTEQIQEKIAQKHNKK